MSKINIIQNAIKELEGGSFQKLFFRNPYSLHCGFHGSVAGVKVFAIRDFAVNAGFVSKVRFFRRVRAYRRLCSRSRCRKRNSCVERSILRRNSRLLIYVCGRACKHSYNLAHAFNNFGFIQKAQGNQIRFNIYGCCKPCARSVQFPHKLAFELSRVLCVRLEQRYGYVYAQLALGNFVQSYKNRYSCGGNVACIQAAFPPC